MKRFWILFTFLFVSSVCLSQRVYDSKCLQDRFEDGIVEQVKTRVELTDNCFIFEEKGKIPHKYYIVGENDEPFKFGSKDSIVNLVGNIYGYEEYWWVIDEDNMEYYESLLLSCNTKEELETKVSRFWNLIVHRVITPSYSNTPQKDLIWITNPTDGGRIIYGKEYKETL